MIYGESILLSYKLQLYLKHVDQPKIPVFLYLENIIINIFTDYYFIITIIINCDITFYLFFCGFCIFNTLFNLKLQGLLITF